ncbi:MAG: hypothetical protein PF542_02250 [Nanoarchaeota archaeon]|nr:hypothetical protein [Nanoarchaeota archaeon]
MTVKGDELQGKIVKLLSSSEQLVSTQDISIKLNKPWHSVQTRCLMLQIAGKVNGFRVGRMNLWSFIK